MSSAPQGPASAARAAFTAASTSASPASDTRPSRRASTGERFSKVLPDAAATNAPPMKLSMLAPCRAGGVEIRFMLRSYGYPAAARLRPAAGFYRQTRVADARRAPLVRAGCAAAQADSAP